MRRLRTAFGFLALLPLGFSEPGTGEARIGNSSQARVGNDPCRPTFLRSLGLALPSGAGASRFSGILTVCRLGKSFGLEGEVVGSQTLRSSETSPNTSYQARRREIC